MKQLLKAFLIFILLIFCVGLFTFYLGESSYGIKDKGTAVLCADIANSLGSGGLLFIVSAIGVALYFIWEYKKKKVKLTFKTVLPITIITIVALLLFIHSFYARQHIQQLIEQSDAKDAATKAAINHASKTMLEGTWRLDKEKTVAGIKTYKNMTIEEHKEFKNCLRSKNIIFKGNEIITDLKENTSGSLFTIKEKVNNNIVIEIQNYGKYVVNRVPTLRHVIIEGDYLCFYFDNPISKKWEKAYYKKIN